MFGRSGFSCAEDSAARQATKASTNAERYRINLITILLVFAVLPGKVAGAWRNDRTKGPAVKLFFPRATNHEILAGFKWKPRMMILNTLDSSGIRNAKSVTLERSNDALESKRRRTFHGTSRTGLDRQDGGGYWWHQWAWSGPR